MGVVKRRIDSYRWTQQREREKEGRVKGIGQGDETSGSVTFTSPRHSKYSSPVCHSGGRLCHIIMLSISFMWLHDSASGQAPVWKPEGEREGGLGHIVCDGSVQQQQLRCP